MSNLPSVAMDSDSSDSEEDNGSEDVLSQRSIGMHVLLIL